MRRKNEHDPLAYPVRLRRPGFVPQEANLSGFKKKLEKQERRSRERNEQLEKRIVSKALSDAGVKIRTDKSTKRKDSKDKEKPRKSKEERA